MTLTWINSFCLLSLFIYPLADCRRPIPTNSVAEETFDNLCLQIKLLFKSLKVNCNVKDPTEEEQKMTIIVTYTFPRANKNETLIKKTSPSSTLAPLPEPLPEKDQVYKTAHELLRLHRRGKPPRLSNRVDKNCLTFDETPGLCVPPKKCHNLTHILKTNEAPTANKIAHKSICGFKVGGPWVCCPKNETDLTFLAEKKRKAKENALNLEKEQDRIEKERPTLPPGDNAHLPEEILTPPGMDYECGYRLKSNLTDGKIVPAGWYSAKWAPAQYGAWPWIVAIGYRDQLSGGIIFECGGSLVSTRFVVTGSRCLEYKENQLAMVRIGALNLFSEEENMVDFMVTEIIKHPQYNPETYENDIALIKLETAVQFTEYVHPICLPYTENLKNYHFLLDDDPYVVGWGSTEFHGPITDQLMEGKVPMVDARICRDKIFLNIDETHICAGHQMGGKEACQGDLGGALVSEVWPLRWILIGVGTFGHRCAEPGFPNVYTRVTAHVDWILDVIKKGS